MSVSDKKALAFEKLATLKNEEEIDQILAHLEELEKTAKTRIYNLSKHNESISLLYHDTLKNLAQ